MDLTMGALAARMPSHGKASLIGGNFVVGGCTGYAFHLMFTSQELQLGERFCSEPSRPESPDFESWLQATRPRFAPWRKFENFTTHSPVSCRHELQTSSDLDTK
jgi:hypothetical protein